MEESYLLIFNIYKKMSNFWLTFEISITKTQMFPKLTYFIILFNLIFIRRYLFFFMDYLMY